MVLQVPKIAKARCYILTWGKNHKHTHLRQEPQTYSPEARTTNISRNSWNSTKPLLFLSTIINMFRTNMELGFNPRASANSVLVSFIFMIVFMSSPLMFSIWSWPGFFLNACEQKQNADFMYLIFNIILKHNNVSRINHTYQLFEYNTLSLLYW